MKSSLLGPVIIVSFVLLFLTASVSAADSSQLLEAYNRMSHPSFDTSSAYGIEYLVIEHKDFRLTLDSGTFYPFEPVDFDSQSIVYGGYFEGRGRFQFTPAVSMEKEQLRRSFGTDSLDIPLTGAELIFEDSEYEQIVNAGTRIAPEMPIRTQQAFEQVHRLISDEHGDYFFGALKAIAQPAGQPFLLVNTDLGASGQVIYEFNPYSPEEVNLLLHHWQAPTNEGANVVCSYSQYLDPSYTNINGMDKSQLAPKHYTISATVDSKGMMQAEAAVLLDITKPVQLVTFDLKPGLDIDSVLDSTGTHISLIRRSADGTSSALHLIFDHRYELGQPLSLRFYYHGNIADMNVNELYVQPGADWYPVYGYHIQTTFDLKLTTPKSCDIVASAKQLDAKQSGDKRITQWQQTRPSTGVTFSLARRGTYDFREDAAPPVEVHYSRSMHNTLADALSSQFLLVDTNLVTQTATDVLNSARVCSYYFGPCIQPKLDVVETLRPGYEVFPGLIELQYDSWSDFEEFPDARLQRAFEVARQWWGNAVTGATPYDRWLSEGFAEYSALMYLQQVTDNETFAARLDQYRDQIFAAEIEPLALMAGSAANDRQLSEGLIMSRKGAFVLHMLRNLLLDPNTMSEDRFLAMMREWYSTGKNRPITTLDFKLLVEKYAGIDMDWFFDEWVYSFSLPTYRFSYTTQRDDQGRSIVTCHIEQQGVPADFKMYIPLEIQFASGSRQYLRLLVDRPVVDLQLPPIDGPVRRLHLNPFNSVLARITQ